MLPVNALKFLVIRIPAILLLMCPAIQASAQVQVDSSQFRFDAYLLNAQEDALAKVRSNIFIRAEPSKTMAYVGEPLQLVYRVYTRLSMNARASKLTAFPGFTSSDVVPEEVDIKPTYYRMDGKVYKSLPARIVHLLPLSPGMKTLPPMQINGQASFFRSRTTVDEMLRWGLGDGYSETVDFTVASEPVQVQVVPLPPPPAGAANALSIGRFFMHWQVIKSPGSTSPDTLEIVFSGEGNFSRIQMPDITWPAGMLPFDARESSALDSFAHPMKGNKTYRIPFTVAKDGAYSLPAMNTWLFDADQRKYYQVSLPALNFEAKANAGRQPASPSADSGASATSIFSRYAPYIFLGVAVVLGGILVWYVLRPAQRKEKVPQPSRDIEEMLEQTPVKTAKSFQPPAEATPASKYSPYIHAEKWRRRWDDVAKEIGLEPGEEISETFMEERGIPPTMQHALRRLQGALKGRAVNWNKETEKEMDALYFRLLFYISNWKQGIRE